MSRRIVIFTIRGALLALMLLTTLALPAPTLAAEMTVTEELNLRSGPSRSARVLALMPAGATVTVTGDPTDGWYPVRYKGTDGYAFGAYLANVSASTTTASGSAHVATDLLNLRSGAGLRFNIIARLPYGTPVEVLGGQQSADGYSWVQVRAANYGTGFVVGAYIASGEPAPAASPPASASSSGNTIIDIITEAALRYGQSPAAMIAVARCESNFDPTLVNPASNASGLFQFLPGTWRTTPYASYSIFDPWASANAAAWMWSVGRRNEWVC